LLAGLKTSKDNVTNEKVRSKIDEFQKRTERLNKFLKEQSGENQGMINGMPIASAKATVGQPTGKNFAIPKRSPPDDDYNAVNTLVLRLQQLIFDEEGFAREYDEVEKETEHFQLKGDFTSAIQPFNQHKNRYKNILPFETTRIKLPIIPGVEGSDYVNASYIGGLMPDSENAYIAAQGPLEHTVEDFWRLIWHTNVVTVVMLAQEIEMGKVKVFRYWPDDATGFLIHQLHVSLVSEVVEGEIITRTISVKDRNTGVTRTIRQYNYIGWPDQGCPTDASGFNSMLKIVNDVNPPGKPMLVHCSAGIGRTGTFLVVHAVLAAARLLLSESFPVNLDVKRLLIRMRSQRSGLVQTADQYKFCYLTMVDLIAPVSEMLLYKNEKWFHKGLKGPQAATLLKDKPPGTFLFRVSSEKGYIVLTANPEGKVMHFKIKVFKEGFQIENGGLFPDLHEVVKSKPKSFQQPLLIYGN